MQRLKRAVQGILWVRLNYDYYATRSAPARSIGARMPCHLIPIESGNAARVAEFREPERADEYRRKLLAGEHGFFVESDGRTLASIWATVNAGAGPRSVREYMRLAPGHALVHDIVTSPLARGRSVGAFMTSAMIHWLLERGDVDRVLVDVRCTNTASNRMMAKLGLAAEHCSVYVSVLRRPLCRLRLPPLGAASVDGEAPRR